MKLRLDEMPKKRDFDTGEEIFDQTDNSVICNVPYKGPVDTNKKPKPYREAVLDSDEYMIETEDEGYAERVQ